MQLVLLTSVDPIPDQCRKRRHCRSHSLDDFFENCICIAITKMQSEISNTIQLYKTFCVDDPNTERQLLIKSLNLLYLLISNNLPTFHAEVIVKGFVHSLVGTAHRGRAPESAHPVLCQHRGIPNNWTLQHDSGVHAPSSKPHLFAPHDIPVAVDTVSRVLPIPILALILRAVSRCRTERFR